MSSDLNTDTQRAHAIVPGDLIRHGGIRYTVTATERTRSGRGVVLTLDDGSRLPVAINTLIELA